MVAGVRPRGAERRMDSFSPLLRSSNAYSLSILVDGGARVRSRSGSSARARPLATLPAGGGLAIAADPTTLDAGWIFPAVLTVAGLLSLLLVITGRR